jgi:hypothetical protein
MISTSDARQGQYPSLLLVMLLNDRNVEEAVFTRIMALMVGWNRADRARVM